MRITIYIGLLLILLSCDENKNTGTDKIKNNTEPKYSNKENNVLSNLQLSYSIIKTRPTKTLKNDSLKDVINTWLNQHENTSIDDLVDFNLELTSNQLTFSFDKCSPDLTSLIKNRKANCIGYSALFNSLMNYTLMKKKLNKK